jgi:hypothetical protein
MQMTPVPTRAPARHATRTAPMAATTIRTYRLSTRDPRADQILVPARDSGTNSAIGGLAPVSLR